MFLTGCHRLYIQGVRRAIRDRLVGAFGNEWWGMSVDSAIKGDLLESLHREIEKDPDRERLLFLDAPHFAWIVNNHHNEIFSDAFPDGEKTLNDFRRLTGLRNRWAHVQEISVSRAWKAAEIMKHILASLRCEEAVEVDQMTQEFVFEPDNLIMEDSLAGLEHEQGDFDTRDFEVAPRTFLHQLQSYLVIEKAVDFPDDQSNEKARVIIRARNTAPDSSGWPSVHFRSVTIRDSRGKDYRLGELPPGATREVAVTFHSKELMGIEFTIYGAIDSERLFQFSRGSTLPEGVISPLKQEFVDRLESIAVRALVDDILGLIGVPNNDMPFAEVVRIRESLKQQVQCMEEKRTALGKLYDDFHLHRASSLGGRTREISLSLVEFEEKLSALDEAIGQTNLDLMNEAVSNLKQVQLSVIRVEDAIRTMTTGS